MSTPRGLAARLAGWEIWPVAAAVAASVALPRLLPAAVGLAAVFWAVRWIARGRPTRRTPADAPIALLVLTLPVTLWATALPEVTRPQVLRLLTGLALFYAIVNWAALRRRVELLALGVALAGLGLAVIAPFTVDWAGGKIPFISNRIYDVFPTLVSDTIHRNVMAGALVILAPCPLALLLFGWRDLSRLVRAGLALCTLAMLATLILTQSRGGLLALVAALLLLAALRWRWGWLGLPAVAVLIAALAWALGPRTLLDFLSTESAITSLEGRMEIWSRAAYMIQDFPFTGIGMGSFTRVADLLYPFFLAPPGHVDHAHSLFLQVAVDLGIPGLVAWLAVLAVVCLSAWRTYREGRRAGDGWVSGLGAGVLASQLALATHGLVDAVVWGLVRTAPLVWALWGLALAGRHSARLRAGRRSPGDPRGRRSARQPPRR